MLTKPACLAACPSPSAPSRLSWISSVAFASRNRPPPIRIRSRPEMPTSSTVNSVACSRMIHVSSSSSRIRVPIAKPRPSSRARWRCASGKRPTRMLMKMMLSTPRTISSSVSVVSATHASGEVIHSIEDSGLFFDDRVRVVEHLRERRRRQVAAEQLAGLGEDRRRAAHADALAELVVRPRPASRTRRPRESRRRASRASARSCGSPRTRPGRPSSTTRCPDPCADRTDSGPRCRAP